MADTYIALYTQEGESPTIHLSQVLPPPTYIQLTMKDQSVQAKKERRLIKNRKSRQRRKNKHKDDTCADCHMLLAVSSEIRSGPKGKNTLCNTCGLKWSRSKKRRSQWYNL